VVTINFYNINVLIFESTFFFVFKVHYPLASRVMSFQMKTFWNLCSYIMIWWWWCPLCVNQHS